MPEPLVVVESLTKTFLHMGRALEVLRGIDLTIDEGEVVAIVGSSGAGKSTLLHCIGTLDIPTSGRLRLGRDELTGLSGAKLAAIRNRFIGFVFQFHHLLPEFNALENVMMPGLIQGRSHREMEGPALSLLREVGLEHRATHRPGELSGGEQQRVALARALVLSPKLILADEPTGNLDSHTSEGMQNLFFEMNKRHGTTIVVVTHDVGFARSMPRVVTMKDGRVANDERLRESPGTRVARGSSDAPAAGPDREAADAPAKGAGDAEVDAPASPKGGGKAKKADRAADSERDVAAAKASTAADEASE
jgi:lipoprotein-releasing system ATP-binding protein